MQGSLDARVVDGAGFEWRLVVGIDAPCVLSRSGEVLARLPWGAVAAAMSGMGDPTSGTDQVLAMLHRRASGVPTAVAAELRRRAIRWAAHLFESRFGLDYSPTLGR